jgi:hypothetical protein
MVERMSRQVGMIDAADWVSDGGRQRLGALNALPNAATSRFRPAPTANPRNAVLAASA